MQAAEVVSPDLAHIVNVFFIHVVGDDECKMSAEVAFLDSQFPEILVRLVHVQFQPYIAVFFL